MKPCVINTGNSLDTQLNAVTSIDQQMAICTSRKMFQSFAVALKETQNSSQKIYFHYMHKYCVH